MKKINLIIFTIFTLSLTFLTSCCDKIDEPYMNTGDGGIVGDTVRKVLLEDFTGHYCVNCPAAHVIIEGLEKVYPKRIVPVVIHAGFFAKPKAAPYDYDFRTPDGTAIATEFGAITAPLPKGMVNRINKGGYFINCARRDNKNRKKVGKKAALKSIFWSLKAIWATLFFKTCILMPASRRIFLNSLISATVIPL